ncbi:MAG: hypothetical protein JWR56_1339 [Massilia sp.]|nr:hypothetical protein [Massilia sp.]
MKALRLAFGAALAVTLSGCLEVEQHPAWVNGKYAGKPDNRVAQVSFHNDKLAWKADILNRNLLQNEYNRANP